MSLGWSIYVDLLVLAVLGGCAWLLWINRMAPIDKVGKGEPMESEYDGIQELNNPLPAWWSWLFIVTLIFGVIYLAIFPGMGSWAGALGWTSRGQYEAEVAAADTRYGPLFAGFAARPIPELLNEPQALDMGGRLFLNHCAACHGSDARGSRGYPNLTDEDWLYGGDPDTIVTTITHGRIGSMPPMGAAMGGDAEVTALANYVLSLSGREHDRQLTETAAQSYALLCAVCHGAEGRGNMAVGAPDLTDDIWLHGGKLADIEEQIQIGRINQMPAHRELLTSEKIHLLAGYVYSLSRERDARGELR